MLKKILVRYKSNLRVKQSFTLLLITAFNIPIGIVSSIIVANFLDVNLFGDFNFIINMFGFAIIIFDFGLLQGGNRVLVLNNDNKKAQEYYGALLICVLILFILMSIFLFIFSQFDNNLKEKGLYHTFIFLIPFGWLFILPRFFETVLYADNKINELAISRFIFSVGHLVFYYIAYKFIHTNKFFIILFFYLIVNFIMFVYLYLTIAPSFKFLRKRLTEILNFTKIFGFHVYLGSLIGVGTSQLTGILISYFATGNVGVGYYSLAIGFSSPLKLIPNTMATTYYKDFANSKKIPLRITVFTIFLSLSAFLTLWIIIQPIISYFYGTSFIPVINLSYISSIGMLFYGLADYYNRFLGANGKGNLLRNSAFLVGLTVIITNFLLIPRFAETGATISFAISGCIYFIVMLYYYNANKKGKL